MDLMRSDLLALSSVLMTVYDVPPLAPEAL